MTGKYVIQHSGSSQFHWSLRAGNGEPILSSQLYTSKQSAETGVQSCRTNSTIDERFNRLTSKDGKPYFVLKAANGEPIGTSEMYSSEAARDKGMASCKENGPSLVAQDDTK
jgi:uncharacterized protein YegP (UPF0339 family)